MTRPGAAPVIGLLVAVPLVFDPRSGNSPSRPKYLLLVAGAAVAGVLLLADRSARHRAWSGNPLRWSVLSLAAWTVVSAASSEHGPNVLSGFPGSYDGVWTQLALATVFFAAAGLAQAHVRQAVTVLALGAGTGVAAFAAAQLLDRAVSPGGWDWARPAASPWTVGGTLGNPNSLAAFIAILLPLLVVLAVLAAGRTRRVLLVLGAVLVGELAVTMSRTGLLAALTGLGALAVLLRRDLRPHWSRIGRGAAAAAALILVVAAAADAAGVAKRDVSSLTTLGDGSTLDLRREVWSAAWRVVTDHPVTGVGPDVFPLVFEDYSSERFMILFGAFTVPNGAHNVFLNTGANVGLPGLALLALLVVLAARLVGRGLRRLEPIATGQTAPARLLLSGIGASLVAYVVQAGFNPQALTSSLCFWALLGFAVTLARREQAYPEASTPSATAPARELAAWAGEATER